MHALVEKKKKKKEWRKRKHSKKEKTTELLLTEQEFSSRLGSPFSLLSLYNLSQKLTESQGFKRQDPRRWKKAGDKGAKEEKQADEEEEEEE